MRNSLFFISDFLKLYLIDQKSIGDIFLKYKKDNKDFLKKIKTNSQFDFKCFY